MTNETKSVRDDVVAYLDGLTWDGQFRIGDGFPEADRRSVRGFMRDAVRRAFEPGCAVERALVLVGAEGVGKSTFVRALMPDPSWVAVTERAQCGLTDVWLVELSLVERGSSRVADESFKAYLTATEDVVWPPRVRYAATETVRVPRSNVVVVTTSDESAIPERSRRYAVVRVDASLLKVVKVLPAVRDAWWAEVVTSWRAAKHVEGYLAALAHPAESRMPAGLDRDAWVAFANAVLEADTERRRVLGRLLAGEPLAESDARHATIARVVEMLALALLDNDDARLFVKALLWPCISAMECAPYDAAYWLHVAEDGFEVAAVRLRTERAEAEARREKILSTLRPLERAIVERRTAKKTEGT